MWSDEVIQQQKSEVIDLLQQDEHAAAENEGCPKLTTYLLDREQTDQPRPLIIVCPGGGYIRRAPHEAEPIARWLNRIGISAAVLDYRVAPYRYPTQLMDAQRAIRMVRNEAANWHVDPNRIGILGFSAGGHLASLTGTHFDEGDPSAADPIERMSSRPDLMVLCYPVISIAPFVTHLGSQRNLLGDNPSEQIISKLSSNEQVSAQTPPTFLWHTADDETVGANNSLLFADAMRKHDIPYELHIFETGKHGLGLGENAPGVQAWPALCEAWLRNKGF